MTERFIKCIASHVTKAISEIRRAREKIDAARPETSYGQVLFALIDGNLLGALSSELDAHELIVTRRGDLR
jgi:hypothetical protein